MLALSQHVRSMEAFLHDAGWLDTGQELSLSQAAAAINKLYDAMPKMAGAMRLPTNEAELQELVQIGYPRGVQYLDGWESRQWSGLQSAGAHSQLGLRSVMRCPGLGCPALLLAC